MKESKELFAMWKNTSKAGSVYFKGKWEDVGILGFYNKKTSDKQPDLQLYRIDEEGKRGSKLCAFWIQNSKAGQKYLTGKYGETKIIGFINNKPKNPKEPYIRFYESKPKEDPDQKPAEAPAQKQSGLPTDDLPF